MRMPGESFKVGDAIPNHVLAESIQFVPVQAAQLDRNAYYPEFSSGPSLTHQCVQARSEQGSAR